MHEDVFASVGLHPNDTARESFNEEFFRELLSQEKVVAVGECGLDFFRTEGTEENKKRQKEIFERHIDIAVEFNKPLMIHCRNAYDDMITILSQKKKNTETDCAATFIFRGKLRDGAKIFSAQFHALVHGSDHVHARLR